MTVMKMTDAMQMDAKKHTTPLPNRSMGVILLLFCAMSSPLTRAIRGYSLRYPSGYVIHVQQLRQRHFS